MEKISVSAYTAQLRLFSGSADPPKSKQAETSSPTSSKALSSPADFQNQDGDSFSLSLEARIVQISLVRTDDDAQTRGSFGTGLAKTLKQALGIILGDDPAAAVGKDAKGITKADDPAQVNSDAVPNGGALERPHHRHHPMGNPEDVASKVLQHLRQEHAQKGGSLQTFVDEIQKKIENRQEARNDGTDRSSDFRAQVDSLLKSGLTAWAQTGSLGLDLQA